MEVEFAESNWVGFGLCPSMDHCDMFTLQLNNQGQISVIDTYSEDIGNPEPDSQNDFNLLAFESTSSGYKAKVQRLLNTGDFNDEVLAENNVYYFCFAYSNSL